MTNRQHTAVPWSYGTLTNLPEGVGVYAFWNRRSGKCVYVGMTADQSIRDRLHQHWSGSHNETLRLWIRAYGPQLDICYTRVERHRIKVLERRLIRLWNPEANVQHKR